MQPRECDPQFPGRSVSCQGQMHKAVHQLPQALKPLCAQLQVGGAVGSAALGTAFVREER